MQFPNPKTVFQNAFFVQITSEYRESSKGGEASYRIFCTADRVVMDVYFILPVGWCIDVDVFRPQSERIIDIEARIWTFKGWIVGKPLGRRVARPEAELIAVGLTRLPVAVPGRMVGVTLSLRNWTRVHEVEVMVGRGRVPYKLDMQLATGDDLEC